MYQKLKGFLRDVFFMSAIVAFVMLYIEGAKFIMRKLDKPKPPAEINSSYAELSREAQKADIPAIQHSIDLFYTLNGRYPEDLVELGGIEMKRKMPDDIEYNPKTGRVREKTVYMEVKPIDPR